VRLIEHYMQWFQGNRLLPAVVAGGSCYVRLTATNWFAFSRKLIWGGQWRPCSWRARGAGSAGVSQPRGDGGVVNVRPWGWADWTHQHAL